MSAQPITEWDLNRPGIVTTLDDSDPRRLRKLVALGILPGCRITLVRRFPSFIVEIEHARFALDSELASGIRGEARD